ncbi:ATP-dependent DNA ligase [Faunimonas pinastri]|uniref:DNA ligase (ATP) n=1 Tax=Faunimonas pinastri TaxID=1855383 RepID=A0A1H9A9K8_9HYPH|nr:ATP-dependent DNA ligase [Faunimonas pinastri]SEP73354.1 ATP-dependent DNA ligase [Faunimonas pinastri]
MILSTLSVLTSTRSMEAKLVDGLPEGKGWQFEPKWDGFRCLAFRAGDEVELHAKSGKPLGRYFPEIVALLKSLPQERFVLDGELCIPVGDTLSFDALQMRLHPAESRIRKLSVETPAVLVLFDCLMDPAGENLMPRPFAERREALEQFFAAAGGMAKGLRLSPFSRDRDEAQGWLDRAGGAIDGVVAKRLADPYQPEERAMLKVKRMRTADCVVGGFRYETKGRQVGSLLLGLYNEAGTLDHVGFTSGFADQDKAELTARLEAMRGGPGFTGNAPGGPSRWSTERSAEWVPLRTELVVEVRYDHITADRFRHGTKIVRWRPDKAPEQCTLQQLEREARPSEVISRVVGAPAVEAGGRG